jgi:hypothetical protein
VVFGPEVAESGWVAIDLAAYEGLTNSTRAFAAPPAHNEPVAAAEASEPTIGGADEKALFKTRLMAWAERLRTPEQRGGSEISQRSPEPSFELAPAPARRIPELDIVKVERKSIGLARPPAVRLLAAPAGAAEILPPAFLKPRLFRSRRARFLLLGMAAAYLVTGLVHSLARWKPGRVIVVPATIDDRTVIT